MNKLISSLIVLAALCSCEGTQKPRIPAPVVGPETAAMNDKLDSLYALETAKFEARLKADQIAEEVCASGSQDSCDLAIAQSNRLASELAELEQHREALLGSGN